MTNSETIDAAVTRPQQRTRLHRTTLRLAWAVAATLVMSAGAAATASGDVDVVKPVSATKVVWDGNVKRSCTAIAWLQMGTPPSPPFQLRAIGAMSCTAQLAAGQIQMTRSPNQTLAWSGALAPNFPPASPYMAPGRSGTEWQACTYVTTWLPKLDGFRVCTAKFRVP